MFKRAALFLVAALFLLAAGPAEAAFHRKVDRDAALAQVEAIALESLKSGTLNAQQAELVFQEVAALKQKGDGLTLDDLAGVDRVVAVFTSAKIESVLLNNARVYVATVLGELRHRFAHVIRDHRGTWE